ncbi:MAG: hypothetical protein KDC95_16130 [Planctomycetes bacterium]|nr:hypothetical protein [Planctomycetota bacterium]
MPTRWITRVCFLALLGATISCEQAPGPITAFVSAIDPRVTRREFPAFAREIVAWCFTSREWRAICDSDEAATSDDHVFKVARILRLGRGSEFEQAFWRVGVFGERASAQMVVDCARASVNRASWSLGTAVEHWQQTQLVTQKTSYVRLDRMEVAFAHDNPDAETLNYDVLHLGNLATTGKLVRVPGAKRWVTSRETAIAEFDACPMTAVLCLVVHHDASVQSVLYLTLDDHRSMVKSRALMSDMGCVATISMTCQR